MLSVLICYFGGMNDRIIQLESLVAMQDETIAKLSDELYRQQQDIFQLRRQFEELEERVAANSPDEQIAGNERPPHY